MTGLLACDDCDVAAVVVEFIRILFTSGASYGSPHRREEQLFRFELQVIVPLQEVSNHFAVFISLDTAGAVADSAVGLEH